MVATVRNSVFICGRIGELVEFVGHADFEHNFVVHLDSDSEDKHSQVEHSSEVCE